MLNVSRNNTVKENIFIRERYISKLLSVGYLCGDAQTEIKILSSSSTKETPSSTLFD